MAYRSLICKVFPFIHNKNNCKFEEIDDDDGGGDGGYGVRKKKQHGKLQSDKMYFIAWFSSINNNNKMTNELYILSKRMHAFE